MLLQVFICEILLSWELFLKWKFIKMIELRSILMQFLFLKFTFEGLCSFSHKISKIFGQGLSFLGIKGCSHFSISLRVNIHRSVFFKPYFKKNPRLSFKYFDKFSQFLILESKSIFEKNNTPNTTFSKLNTLSEFVN